MSHLCISCGENFPLGEGEVVRTEVSENSCQSVRACSEKCANALAA